MTQSMGHQAAMAMDSALPFDTASIPFEFISEDLGKTTPIMNTAGVRGTRWHPSERSRFGINTIGGPIVLRPSPNDLTFLLQRILGAAPVGNVFSVAETLPAFFVLVNRVVETFQYESVYVNTATFRSQTGGFLELTLDTIAKVETKPGPAFPALALGLAAADAPYVHHDLTVTLDGVSRPCNSCEVIINNAMTADHRASVNPTDIDSEDGMVNVNLVLPYIADNDDLYNLALEGIDGSIVYTNGPFSLTFDFGVLQIPPNAPNVGGKGKIPLTLNMEAKTDGATAAIQITNDATP